MKQLLRRNGLSITLFGLFFVFQAGLSLVGRQQYNQEQAEHGQRALSYPEYLGSGSFLVLRQKGSPESKPVDSPHSATGSG